MQPIVHRFEAALFPVNAYLVETDDAVIAVDATLGVSDGRALRARAKTLDKPLAAVIVTHSHPDHYGGITALLDGDVVPIYAVDGVDRVIRRDDRAKDQILRPMFGNEWAATRTFPTHVVGDGGRVQVGGATFVATDLGPGESPHDSLWRLEGVTPAAVFIGDLAYSRMHAFLADGFYEQWLANLDRAKRTLPPDAMLFMGHGQPARGHALFDEQANYIRQFVATLRTLVAEGAEGDALADQAIGRMKGLLPTDDLLFLLKLSVDPMRSRLSQPAS